MEATGSQLSRGHSTVTPGQINTRTEQEEGRGHTAQPVHGSAGGELGRHQGLAAGGGVLAGGAAGLFAKKKGPQQPLQGRGILCSLLAPQPEASRR